MLNEGSMRGLRLAKLDRLLRSLGHQGEELSSLVDVSSINGGGGH